MRGRGKLSAFEREEEQANEGSVKPISSLEWRGVSIREEDTHTQKKIQAQNEEK